MTTIEIQNLKCHGCANTITKAINKMQGITDFSIDVDESKISFNSNDSELIKKVKN